MDKIKTTLLYIFIILLIYVVLYTYIYNNKELTFDNYINNNNIKKLNFINLKDKEGIIYKTNLNNFETILENIKNDDLPNLYNKIKPIKNEIQQNNESILEKLTELYFKQYIEYIDKQNAAVYNEYLRYNNPKKIN